MVWIRNLLWTSIWEVCGSNIGEAPAYPDRVTLYQFLQANDVGKSTSDYFMTPDPYVICRAFTKRLAVARNFTRRTALVEGIARYGT